VAEPEKGESKVSWKMYLWNSSGKKELLIDQLYSQWNLFWCSRICHSA